MQSVLAILFLAQTAAAAPPPAIDIIRPPDTRPFDLTTFRSRTESCSDPIPTGDEVVVCARLTDMPASLAAQAEMFEPRPFRPKWRLLGGEGGVQLEQRSTLMGSAPALMATFKLRF